MNKKFLSAILFGALMVTSTGTFVSCKDYDDDIENLQSQIDKKASVEELTSKVSAVESALNEAKAGLATTKADAEKALKAAQDAAAAAKTAGDAAAAAKAAADAAAAQVDLKAAEAKEAAIKAAQDKVADLKAEVKASVDANKEDLAKLSERLTLLLMKWVLWLVIVLLVLL